MITNPSAIGMNWSNVSQDQDYLNKLAGTNGVEYQPLLAQSSEQIPTNLIGARFPLITDPDKMPKLGIKGTLASSGMANIPSVNQQVPTQPAPTSPNAGLAKGIGAGAGFVSDAVQSVQNARMQDYSNQMQQTQQGMTFDKNADYAPTFDEFAGDMPSAEQAVGGAGGAIGGGALKGAASGAAVGTSIAPGPGTAIGAGVGAIVGAIEGIFGWDSAKDTDAKNKAAALKEYERKLKEWTYNQNSRIAAKTGDDIGEEKKSIAQNAALGYQRKKEAAVTSEERRQMMIQTIMNVGNLKTQQQQQNASVWG